MLTNQDKIDVNKSGQNYCPDVLSVSPKWISADGFPRMDFSHSASIQQRTSRNKLPKIVILFDEQITFSKTLCKQAFLPISFARKYYGTLSISSHLPIFSRLTF